MPGHGELIEQWDEGPVRVLVRHSCAARDLYELLTVGPLPPALRDVLAATGQLRGSDALYVVEVAGQHQLTVAQARGRLVVMPRLSVARPAQRAAAVRLAEVIASLAGARAQGP